MIETQFNTKIKILRTDGGREDCNTELSRYLVSNGILHQMSCPYTPEQNGLAERKHRHIIETTRTLLQMASLPYSLWFEALLTVI